MATRNDFDDFFGDDDEVPVTDTRADGRLYRVPLTRLSPNLVNPRSDFGTEDQLIDLGKSLARRQNQACPVVSRNAYLKLWPDHRDQVKDVDYILVSGERRYRAATVVGLAVLDCIVNDDFAADRKTFLDAVVSENVDRQNFDPIEEAYAVQALVAEFGSNRAVAQHFDRVDGWVTQRLLLTHLDPQMQALVRQKDVPLDAARSLGKLARDKNWSVQQQFDWWQEEQERRTATAVARAAVRKANREASTEPSKPPAALPAPVPFPSRPVQQAPGQQQSSFTAVKLHTADNPVPGPDQQTDPVPPPKPGTTAESVPEQRPKQAPGTADARTHPSPPESDQAPRLFPYDDPKTSVLLCHQKMSREGFVAHVAEALRVLRREHPDDFQNVLEELPSTHANQP